VHTNALRDQKIERIKILLADDQELFSANLKVVLETMTDDITVVGIASNGEEAVSMAEEKLPDIVLMDVRMPVLDGVHAVKTLHARHPEIKIVMLTTFLDDDYVEESIQYGAYGYILKNINPDNLISSIRAIYKGAVLFSPDLLGKIAAHMNSAIVSIDSIDEYREIINDLGQREKEILKLMAQGLNNKKIADALFISELTVRNYISSIYAKIGSKDRLEVMSIARKVKIGADRQ
jgi:DNA-binding NarL/FixJ family response regulator